MNQAEEILEAAIVRLGIRSPVTSDLVVSPAEIEQQLGNHLPPLYFATLAKFQHGAVFDNGALFTPSVASGREGKDGRMSLNFLYGCQQGISGVLYWNLLTGCPLPTGLIAIGAGDGGDQICLGRADLRVVFWKHDADELLAVSEIASDFDVFLQNLMPDDRGQSAREIDEENSFLDF